MHKQLPSWNDTPTRHAILNFVNRIIDETSLDYVPPAERIAAFDNDGTLWCEKPMYIHLDSLLCQLATQAETEPSLRSKQQ